MCSVPVLTLLNVPLQHQVRLWVLGLQLQDHPSPQGALQVVCGHVNTAPSSTKHIMPPVRYVTCPETKDLCVGQVIMIL
ncbi:Hypp5345 [Branchiostoma lanceolatum]|uniref:Hypp5345 protein n=1 Tax=Branchiostoma lanceolatum TaxID=7740 RepID=A0A8K0EZC1_BRALA|nr:Hypp5345 [Branchiostoma lanceolatum]